MEPASKRTDIGVFSPLAIPDGNPDYTPSILLRVSDCSTGLAVVHVVPTRRCACTNKFFRPDTSPRSSPSAILACGRLG